MSATVTPSRITAIDAYVKEFEAAWYRAGGASVSAYLPPRSDPLYHRVARELVRVDLELGWDCGRPRNLDAYRTDYPDLFADSDLIQVMAFEEYRQRREHGEDPDANEYAQRFGVCTDDWPGADDASSSAADATARTDGGRAMEAASIAYRQFRQAEAKEFDPRTGLAPGDALDVFRNLHAADPRAADSLAEAVLAMPHVGSHFLGFRLVEELGRGAFGRVFLAHQGELAGRPVALKISADLHSESQALAQFCHTNIVPIYSIHRAGHFQAVCMPYLGSTTLGDVLRDLRSAPALPASGRQLLSTLNDRKSRTHETPSTPKPQSSISDPANDDSNSAGAVPATEVRIAFLDDLAGSSYVEAVLRLTAHLAAGLAHAHERGILHRDLKPANVLLRDDGEPMLLDFNLAQDTKLSGCASGARMGGTLPYMAPEQIEAFQGVPGAVVDARSDLFALGVIVFELLTGKFPFPTRPGGLSASLALMVLDRREAPPRLCPHNPAVTPATEAIVRRCLAPEPGDRYPSARALQEDIERHLADLPLKHTPEPSRRERLRKWTRRHPKLTSSTTVGALAAAILLMCAGGAAAFWNNHQQRLDVARREQARLAAIERRDQLRLAKHQQQALVNDPERATLLKLIELSRTSLAAYDIPDDSAWLDSALVINLPSAEQARLRQDAAEMLLTWSAAERRVAEGETDADRRTAQLNSAWKLTERAEASLGTNASKALWRQRARLAYLLNRDDAEELDEKADATVAQTVLDHFLEARDFLRQREFLKALPHLQEVTRQDPQHFWAWFLLGECHFESAKLPESIDCYSASLGTNPPPSAAFYPYYYRAQTYFAWNRLSLAETDLDEAEKRVGDLPTDMQNRARTRTALQKARLLERKGQYPAAEAVLTGVLGLKVQETEVYLERSRLRDKQGDKRGAQRDREECSDRNPTDEAGWNTRGLAELSLNPNAALSSFEKALALNPRYYPALQNKAHVLAEKLDKPAESLAVLDRIVEMYPGYVPARIGRGVVLARQGKRVEAHADVLESLARDRSAATYYQAANVYALTSRQEPADRERVIPLLSAALCNGFGLDLIDDDADMDPVRDQVSFQRLVSVVRQLQAELQRKEP